MSMMDMINSAGVPAGATGSLFKLPASDQFSDLSLIQGSMGDLSTMCQASAPGTYPPELFSNLTTSMASVGDIQGSLTTQIGKLGSNLPMMQSAQGQMDSVAKSDSIASGNAPTSSGDKDATMASALPTSGACPGFSFKAAFAPITQAASVIGSSISSMMSIINSAMGTALSSVSDLVSHISGIISGAISATTSQLSSILGGVHSAFSDMKGTFDTLFAGAESAVSDAMSFLQNLNIVKMLSGTNPCINDVLGEVVDKNAVDPLSLNANKNIKSFDLPIDTGIALAKNGGSLPDIDLTVKRPLPLTTIPDAYTTLELQTLDSQLANYRDETNLVVKDGATQVAAIEEWKTANNYNQLKQQAGVTSDNPDGDSNNTRALAAWQAVQSQYQEKADAYNNSFTPLMASRQAELAAMQVEYNYRMQYGKTPWTTMQSLGLIPPQQTTLLDIGI